MIDRPIPTLTRVRAGSSPQQLAHEQARHWMQVRAPSFRSLARDRQRREQLWAWLSLVVLIVCWDASSRLGERVSPPRPKLAHVADEEEMFLASASSSSLGLGL
jgi:hypothetical protein